jgi:ATP-binding cassette subfamily B protein
MRAQLFRHAQRLSVAHHDLRGTSDATYRIQYDAPAAQTVATDGIIPFITSGLTLVSMVAATARIDAPLAIVALAICPILLFVSQTYRRRFRHQARELKTLETSALSVVQEALSAIRVVKAFGQEEHEEQRFLRQSGHGVFARLRLAMAEGSFSLQIGLITALGTAAVMFVGAQHVRQGVLTLGELLMVMAYLSQLYDPLRSMSKKATSLQSSLASAERVFALLDSEPDVVERPHARHVSRVRGEVEFRDVGFSYDASRPILQNVSLQIPAGTRLGISGTTGAGKTTLVSLLTRFYDPTAGAILLDGVDLRDYRLIDLRNQYGIVLQEPVLFSTSIAENIAYARPTASESDLVAAAKLANAHEFISRLPAGYDTLVGERGMRLSGGERQRISLARAFLRDAPILILDEPTSSVDMQTESEIIDAIESLMRNRTTIMIAHRLSTLERCDLRATIDHGRVVEVWGDASQKPA